MADAAALDFPTTRALVRLRFALEHALQLAKDPSEPGAHIAVVALDGAVEYALWLVAQAYSVPLKREHPSRDELLRSIRTSLNSPGATRKWRPTGGPGLNQLHRARNQAQHAAVPVKESALPDWSSATRAFIESLVEAAFGYPLNEVALADAVRDQALADLLRRAEAAIAGGPDSGAFLLVCNAFAEARKRWREQRLHFQGALFIERADQAPPLPLIGRRAQASQEERLDDFLEVAPFANDLGEYFWFRGASNQLQRGWIPGSADARRALVFVSGWIVRWEVFDRGYPVDRWEAHWESLSPPVSGDGSKTEVLAAETYLTTEHPGQARRCVLVVTLANIPDRARGPWGHWLAQGLFDAAQELGGDFRFDHVRLGITGELTLHCQLGYDPDAVAAAIRRGVELTDERYHAWQSSRLKRLAELHELQDAYAAVLHGAGEGSQVFGAVRVTERQADAHAVVSLQLKLGDTAIEELNLCSNIFRSLGGVFAATTYGRSALVFDAFELTPERQATFQEAIQRCEGVVSERRAHRAGEVRDFQSFANRIGQLFDRENTT